MVIDELPDMKEKKNCGEESEKSREKIQNSS